jgi:hypothetical protein
MVNAPVDLPQFRRQSKNPEEFRQFPNLNLHLTEKYYCKLAEIFIG